MVQSSSPSPRASAPPVASMRRRIILGAAFATAAILIASVLAQVLVRHTGQRNADNIQARSEVVSELEDLRVALWAAEAALTDHLLFPWEQAEEDWTVHFSKAQAVVEGLALTAWAQEERRQSTFAALKDDLAALNTRALELIALRSDADRLYPAVRLARVNMRPMNQQFINAANLAIDSLRQERDSPQSSRIFNLFSDSRYFWAQMIGNFRRYIANRLGSFSIETLAFHEEDVKFTHEFIQSMLDELQQLDDEGRLGFQESASLADMRAAATAWFEGFVEVKRLHASDEWRADVTYRKSKMHPHYDRIAEHLRKLSDQIAVSAAADVESSRTTVNTIIAGLWVLALLLLAVLAAGIFYFDRRLLRPIARVADALKAEAEGQDHVSVPVATVTETQTLVDAFAQMRKQVHTRQLALEHQALHDSLTGLPNRALLHDRLAQAIATNARGGGETALLVLDVDRFKDVNDTLGHQFGDRMLIEVGARLLAEFRASDTVARLGGDEFAVVLPATGEAKAFELAHRVRQTLEEPFRLAGHNVSSGCSIGIAVFPVHGGDTHSLIRQADVAMYLAKRRGSGVVVYRAEDDEHSIGRLAMVTQLREALAADKLTLTYHPKIDLRTNAIVGVEALVRWTHAQRGVVPPDEFVPVAEHTGLIKQLSSWVLNRALDEHARLRAAGHDLSLAVNLSAFDLEEVQLAKKIAERLEQWKLPAELLVLEITESAMMSHPTRAFRLLSELDEMGVRLSVDDFGTGYSSLAYLKRLPVDELKIDRSFVINMATDNEDAVIVRSTIELARNLGISVVAEGVESRDAYEMLKTLECEAAQGHFFCRAMPLGELLAWLGMAKHDWHSPGAGRAVAGS